MRAFAALMLILFAAPVSAAEKPFLALPLDCKPGRTCVIEDYVDADPGPGQRDYTGGIKSRDGHRGTDIALTSDTAMADGAAVLAAAPGRVEATRDGVPDRPYTDALAEELKGKECGNAVRISHDNGLQTLYCHMEQGSVRVKTGDLVARGDFLGYVGMSGQSNYPHVHISVLKDGKPIDPFAPDAEAAAAGETLWLDPMPYTPSGMFTAGFAAAVPSFEDVQSGAARITETTPDSPLVLYSHFFEARDGDVLRLAAAGPEGAIFGTMIRIDDAKRNMFRAFGRKAPSNGWPPGDYRGTARLERAGKVLAVRFTEITVR